MRERSIESEENTVIFVEDSGCEVSLRVLHVKRRKTDQVAWFRARRSLYIEVRRGWRGNISSVNGIAN